MEREAWGLYASVRVSDLRDHRCGAVTDLEGIVEGVERRPLGDDWFIRDWEVEEKDGGGGGAGRAGMILG